MAKPDDGITLYHNPRCSKSREALKLLRERGVQPRIVEYLRDPPDRVELERILELLHMEPRDLMRRKEPAYGEANLDDPGLTRDTLVLAMIQRPILIERPIAVRKDAAVLGRPPKRVLEILRDGNPGPVL